MAVLCSVETAIRLVKRILDRQRPLASRKSRNLIISSMLTALMTLLATLSSSFRSRATLELENLALRHQIGVLRRAAAKRLKLTSADRLLWICLSRLWRGWGS